MVFGIDDAMMAALVSGGLAAGGSVVSGMMGGRGPKETKQQRTSRKTANELLASLKGEGPFSGLFATSEADFNKSFRDPMLAQFRNQIAPQIQQQYIASGQQRGTGLEDQLLRAGIDLDQMLNQEYMKYKQGGQDRMSNALNSIVGMGAGAPVRMGAGEAALSGLAGFAGGGGLQNVMSDYGASQRWNQYMNQPQPIAAPPGIQSGSVSRPQGSGRGFAQDWNYGYGG